MAWRTSEKLIRFTFKGVGERSVNLCRVPPKNLGCLLPQTRRVSTSEKDRVTEGLLALASVEKDEQLTRIFQEYHLQLDIQDKRGWTPLMHAAKAGNKPLMQMLLNKGASASERCKYGHTAADIAQFWQNRSCWELVDSGQEKEKQKGQEEHFFGGLYLDRASQLREDSNSLDKVMQKKDTQFVLMHKLAPLLKRVGKKTALFMADHQTIKELSQLSPKISLRNNQTAFLGLKNERTLKEGHTRTLSIHDRQAVFCVDISEVEEELLDKVEPDVEVASHPLALLGLSRYDAALCSQAKALLHWHRNNQFCPSCGTRTESEDGGYKRVCQNDECYTRHGVHNTSHPRVDPSIISLIISPDRLHCLLAKGLHTPPGMYTCLAGFVEPGESVSMACRREVREEVGVDLGCIEMRVTQPWPSPSVLMIACIAEATTTHLQVDEREIADARWFSREEVVDLITMRHKERFFIPPRQALAYHLVKDWLKQTAFL